MDHTPEFYDKPEKKVLAPKLAEAYRATFTTDAGKRVLADLRAKFGHDRPRFVFNGLGQDSPVTYAAKVDGQCDVLREIETAISLAEKQG